MSFSSCAGTLSIYFSIATLLMAFSYKNIHKTKQKKVFFSLSSSSFLSLISFFHSFLRFRVAADGVCVCVLVMIRQWRAKKRTSLCVQTQKCKDMKACKAIRKTKRMKSAEDEARVVCKRILHSCNYIICFISYINGYLFVFTLALWK